MNPTGVPHRRFRKTRELLRRNTGQSLIEVALCMPLLTLLMAYSIDFGYFFIVAANITSAARNAAQYSVLGYQAAAQTSEPTAGPISLVTSVAAIAVSDLSSLVSNTTTTTIQVCSKVNGTSGGLPICTSYGPAGTTYTPTLDPESPTFTLQRVDVTYTVQPPVPMSFFSVSLLPSLKFHRQVSMRAMD